LKAKEGQLDIRMNSINSLQEENEEKGKQLNERG